MHLQLIIYSNLNYILLAVLQSLSSFSSPSNFQNSTIKKNLTTSECSLSYPISMSPQCILGRDSHLYLELPTCQNSCIYIKCKQAHWLLESKHKEKRVEFSSMENT